MPMHQALAADALPAAGRTAPSSARQASFTLRAATRLRMRPLKMELGGSIMWLTLAISVSTSGSLNAHRMALLKYLRVKVNGSSNEPD